VDPLDELAGGEGHVARVLDARVLRVAVDGRERVGAEGRDGGDEVAPEVVDVDPAEPG
jgi:hypothetical protein